ncbi:prephenate dehydratase [Bythopirellula polymerisocia]|uniref:Bifunctional chorismate mutase/prephenate dehydratase n=1 Tax=Bythopirellula polymerisocia TaxID=2528003 RepID=A0A5C6CMS6_9BACT|nr:prephenate dehydratase [Bythopirellula polymerisocia]TWU25692.1 P-protein [Bythopirellula polymerisocia]
MAKKKKSKRPGKTTSSGVKAPAQRQIDKLDQEILELINRRAELAIQRKRTTPTESADLRESLEHVVTLGHSDKGPLSADSVRSVFREILSGTQAASQVTRVAYLGPEFTYSHLAAIERFGQSAELVPVATIAAVFEEVERGHANFGLVPIENSTDGRVADALECLARSPIQICGEVPLRIRHCLLANCSRSSVVRVYSKRQPLSQCRNWLSQHLPDAQLIEVSSSAEAARKAAEESGSAAIASEQAGVNHEIAVLSHGIEDNSDNVTRFAVIGKESAKKTGNDKTAVVFEIDHQPGALADAMGIFKRQKLNMTWIESFPLPGQRGSYLFFVEFQGHASQLRARRALAALEKRALRLTLLGSYAQTEPIG